MPIIWQWVVLYSAMVCLLVLGFWAALYSGWGIAFLVIVILISIALMLYSGYALGTLLKGVRKLSDGELSHKIPTDHLHGSFRECAVEMNTLSETTMVAVQNQVRAERMKTELITNVSHDIKTPLTSIINFVDLLGKPHSPEANKQYLEILSRQSNQLKKLIEDLMELSKASSGNLQANIMTMDVAESVNQALGEFSDKLEKVHLIPVFHQPEEPVLVAADGRLTWRVLSNLLSNAVKYATPGTRVYVEIAEEADTVQLSIKNVSKEELRLSAEDLLERFVRGDASRNREGSGLGLNIAKTLMEVQGGSLQLTLDGDLFKVTLTFPAAE
jgi:signal transduction histidine kinase